MALPYVFLAWRRTISDAFLVGKDRRISFLVGSDDRYAIGIAELRLVGLILPRPFLQWFAFERQPNSSPTGQRIAGLRDDPDGYSGTSQPTHDVVLGGVDAFRIAVQTHGELEWRLPRRTSVRDGSSRAM